MLNGAKPFDITHKAQTAHFHTSGTPVFLEHLLDLQTDLGFKQEYHILSLSMLTQWSAGLRTKNSTHVLTSWLWFRGWQRVAWTLDSVLSPDLSMSCCCTLCVDVFTFFNAMFTGSLGLG